MSENKRVDSRCLVVLGMHRSGTSLVSGWLNQCGVNFGDRLMGAGLGNSKGHYEDLDFHDLHEHILEYNKIAYGGISDLKRTLELDDYHLLRLRYNVRLKMDLREQWGWKDPRTCLFIEEYKDILPNAYFLILYREANDVVNSLLSREYARMKRKLLSAGRWSRYRFILNQEKIKRRFINKNRELFLNAWFHYNQKILDSFPSNDQNYYALNLDNVNNQWETILEWLDTRGFLLQKKDFNNVFDKQMLGKTFCNLIWEEETQIKINSMQRKLFDFCKGKDSQTMRYDKADK